MSATPSLPSIADLVTKREWDVVMQALRDRPEIASKSIMEDPNAAPTEEHENLCLHEVCKNEPPLEVVDMLLAIHPDAATTVGRLGYLPLHYACCSGASVEVIERLVQASRSGIRTADDDNKMLPLHMACESGADQDVIALLLVNYPEASLVRDIYDRVPMDYAHSIRSMDTRQGAVEALKKASMLCVTSEAARERLEDEYQCKIRGIEEANTAHVKSVVATHDKAIAALKKISDNRKMMEQDMRKQLAERDERILALEKAMADQERKYERLLATERENVARLEGVVEEKKIIISTKISEYNQLSAEKRGVEGVLANTQLKLSQSRTECAGVRSELADRDGLLSNIDGMIATFRQNIVPTPPAPFNDADVAVPQEIDTVEALNEADSVGGGSDGPEMNVAPVKGLPKSSSTDEIVVETAASGELRTPIAFQRVGESFESEASAARYAAAHCE